MSFDAAGVAKLAAVFVSCLGLAFAAGSLAFVPRQTYAEVSAAAAADVDLSIDSVISLATSPDINMTIMPLPTGVGSSATVTATVSTNNVTGYYLDLNAQHATVAGAQGSIPGTSLIHTNAINVVPSSNNTLAGALSVNTWGYNVGTSTTAFLAIPPVTNPDTVRTTATPVSGEVTSLTFGAKADTTVAAGIYAQTLVLTAVTYPAPIVPHIATVSGVMRGGNTLTIVGEHLDNITSLTVGNDVPCYIQPGSNTATGVACTLPTTLAAGPQRIKLANAMGVAEKSINYVSDTGFTNDMCAAMPDYNPAAPNPLSTSTITDNRNGQTYRIRKMQDGKCWMISNLRYLPVGNAAGVYGLVEEGNYMTVDGTTDISSANADVPFYYDYPTGSDDYASDTFYGYLYNWYGATAGTGTYGFQGVARSSICPSPFGLPTGNVGDDSDEAMGDFGVLDRAFGGLGTTLADSPLATNVWRWAGPWAGVPTGYWSDTITYSSTIYAWSATTVSATAVNKLSIATTAVSPGTSNTAKRGGVPVRCVLVLPD